MLIMAIDYGERRTGVAFSDPSGTIAGRTLVIDQRSRPKTLDAIIALVAENSPEQVVIGYPRNMNGSLGPGAEKCAALAEQLKSRVTCGVTLWDERLTTVDAHRILAENGRKAINRKNTVDAVAASLILEGYLASLK